MLRLLAIALCLIVASVVACSSDETEPQSTVPTGAGATGGGGTTTGTGSGTAGSGGAGGACDETPSPPADVEGTTTEGTVVGELRTYGTIHSLGVEWDLTGDTDHDATCTVRYRPVGGCHFLDALPLMRGDYAWHYHDEQATEAANLLAGSMMFLTPGTTYEVVLELEDPDGGSAMRVIELSTRAIPEQPTGGNTYHVVPGSGGGDGSQGDPFQGIAAADAVASPGDVFLLHQGTYGGTQDFATSGAPGNYVVWKAAGDGDAILEYGRVTANHVWIDGLTFVRNADTNGLRGVADATDVVVTNNSFTGYHYSINLSAETSSWTITDNTIVGDKAPGVGLGDSGDFGGEGVELGHSVGHVVAYNRISQVSDGVSYALVNCDIYGNDIFDTADDGVEPDYGFANVRVWGNRIHDVAAYHLSFQPQKLGPWYFIRNQIAGANHGIFKFRTQDRLVFVNNTFVHWGTLVSQAHVLMASLSRNNLYISADGAGPVWRAADSYDTAPEYYNPPQYDPGWNTDVDYDGFDWSGASPAFRWRDGQESYDDLASFAAAVGIEQHGVAVDKASIFEDFFVPSSRAAVPRQQLTLQAGSNAVDAGAPLPNVADVFEGTAPDLGAYEVGRASPHYGPRTQADLPTHATYWALH
ncbi:MAG: right-handed parallel beta-helix repeat-containing protein [Deltaproteobacteria bacterium]|jgi:hypothetical protein|nr:right-handed parallel beta-helix repeat-containing protein [Deltaproteobacteria bacterium]MBW2533617.1 right-handed parallel beta-helix repeat-containing protein [Deltaproteobacteria bacterium]